MGVLGVEWEELSQCWHPAVAVDALPPILMVNVFCDESDDGTTYALAGWLTSPTGWDHFVPRWQAMLANTAMPDGSAMPAFHAVEIVERDNISDSRFKGWTFEDEKAVFTKAVDAIEYQAQHGWLQRVGVSMHIPLGESLRAERDVWAWVMLFHRFMSLLLTEYRAQNGFSLVFDNKQTVRAHVNKWLDNGYQGMKQVFPGKFIDPAVAFMSAEGALPLQAADLLAYEWRKRSSDRVLRPHKPIRKSYERLKAVTEGHLAHYGPDQMRRLMEHWEASGEFEFFAVPTTLEE